MKDYTPIKYTHYSIIEEGDDLNTLTETGAYVCNSSSIVSSILNKPEGLTSAFKLINEEVASSGWIRQVIYENASCDIFVRATTKTGGTKTGWVRILTENA